MNISFTPIPDALPKPSQSPDTSKDTPTRVPLPESSNPPSPNGTTSGLPANQDVKEGGGETENQIPKVSLAPSVSLCIPCALRTGSPASM